MDNKQGRAATYELRRKTLPRLVFSTLALKVAKPAFEQGNSIGKQGTTSNIIDR